jgi:hypothetical protein
MLCPTELFLTASHLIALSLQRAKHASLGKACKKYSPYFSWRWSRYRETNMLLWEGMQKYSPYFLRSYGDEPLVPMCEREKIRARKSIVALILQ